MRVGLLVLLFSSFAAACGDTEASTSESAVSTAGTGGTGSGASVAATSGTGSGGADTSSTTGGGGSVPVSCTGMWGAPQAVLVDTSGENVQSLAITQNELVLFFAYGSSNQVRVSSRSSANDTFVSSAPVPELSALCNDGMIPLFDVSQDGLDAYVACVPTSWDCAISPCTVQHASRPTTDASFSLEGVVASGVGASPSISLDGLRLFTSSLNPIGGSTAPLVATRASTASPFGEPVPIAGAEQWTLAMIAPEVSADELEIYGSGTFVNAMLMAQRGTTTDPFTEPFEVEISVPGTYAGTPDLTADCRALYFSANTAGAETVYVMRR